VAMHGSICGQDSVFVGKLSGILFPFIAPWSDVHHILVTSMCLKKNQNTLTIPPCASETIKIHLPPQR
jgi:hypothetical protein